MNNYKFEIFNNYNELNLNYLNFSFNPDFGNTYCDLKNSKYLLFSFKGEYFGLIPVLIKESFFLNTLQILYNPINFRGKKFIKNIEQLIIDDFIIFLKFNKLCDRIIQPPNWVIFQSFPENSKYVPFGTYVLPLKANSIDDIWSNLHPKNRNVIRNAQKHNLTIKIGYNELNIFYSLYADTMNRSKIFLEPYSFFRDLVFNFKNHIYIAVVYNNEKPLGAIFGFYTNYKFYYLYGASANSISPTGAINYLHFETIKFMKSKNVKSYDFVGARLSNISDTKFSGIQKFKKRFGSVLIKGLIWKLDLNLFKCKIYDFLIVIIFIFKFKKKDYDIIDQEFKKFHET